jgi:hypothetical protein
MKITFLGKEVKRKKSFSPDFIIHRDELHAGMYIYN